MWLKRISIVNYKNLEQAELTFSRKMNCIIGKNGMGKTNLMDAVYYLSFAKVRLIPLILRISGMSRIFSCYRDSMRRTVVIRRKYIVG